jgi:hypothetical protein
MAADRRNGLRLDRRRLGISGGFDRLEQFGGEAEVGEGHAISIV